MATEQDLLNDREIKTLLLEAKPVSADEYQRWLKEYLGSHPTSQDYQKLIEALSGVIYADGTVQVQEAELFNTLQQPDPSIGDKVRQAIGRFYRQAVYGNKEAV